MVRKHSYSQTQDAPGKVHTAMVLPPPIPLNDISRSVSGQFQSPVSGNEFRASAIDSDTVGRS